MFPWYNNEQIEMNKSTFHCLFPPLFLACFIAPGILIVSFAPAQDDEYSTLLFVFDLVGQAAPIYIYSWEVGRKSIEMMVSMKALDC